jgi:hypothetical protein
MGIIVFLGVLVVVFVVGLVVALITRSLTPAAVAAVAAVVLVIVLLFTSIASVGTSEVGIVTFGGHTKGHDLPPGYHAVAPWESVTKWDDSVQPSTFQGKKCLQIRIAGSQSACLNVKVQWRDNPAGSDSQFRKYKNFDNVTSAFMSRIAVEGFFNNVFETFDPVAEATLTKAGETSGTTVTSLTAKVRAQMQGAYKGQITIVALSGGNISYDHQVETALNALTTAKAKTNVATQNEATALAQKAAANDLAGAKLTPAVLYQTCLNDTLEMTHIPAAWNCGSPQSLALLLNGK